MSTRRFEGDELAAHELALTLGIRTPRIRRVVPQEDQDGDKWNFVLLDRIPGVALSDTWPTLGWFASLRVGLQLRQVVQSMRSQTSLTAGGLVSGECNSMFFEDAYGPPRKATAFSLTSYINWWLNFRPPRSAAPPSPPNLLSIPRTLYFTHQDLSPRNLILSPSNDLWILDWDHAGWYPQCFEYLGTQDLRCFDGWSRWAKWRWKMVQWLATGIWRREWRLLEIVRERSMRWPLARQLIADG